MSTMRPPTPIAADDAYSLIVVGTGFASTFFLHEYLRHAPPSARVLVLERGRDRPHRERVANRDRLYEEEDASYVNATSHVKPWQFSFGFGGSSQCWWACTPRMLPADFRLRSTYGVGADWPLDYDTLEPFYGEAEELMQVAGASDRSPVPRSRPFPQPPHTWNRPDALLAEAFPDAFFPQPTARPTRSVPGGRPACCGAGVCGTCPIDSKFTIRNGLAEPYEDPRVDLRLEAQGVAVETAAGRVTGVLYRQSGAEYTARGEGVVLGANALFNPALLLRSGIDDGGVGQGLVEQRSQRYVVDLDGVDGYQGSTSLTGHGYLFYDGLHRSEHAGCLIETSNIPDLRPERGKWRQRMAFKLIFEDLRRAENRVELGEDDRPVTRFEGASDYTERGLRAIRERLPELLAPLPVERVRVGAPSATEAHILGTHVMGDDPETSVVDHTCVHHRLRNLVVLGGGTFPTAAPANPTLTICALSLWSARRLYGRP